MMTGTLLFPLSDLDADKGDERARVRLFYFLSFLLLLFYFLAILLFS